MKKSLFLATIMLTTAHAAMADNTVISSVDHELNSTHTHAASSVTSTQAEMKEAATTLGCGVGAGLSALGFSTIKAVSLGSFGFAKASGLLLGKLAPFVALPLAGYYTYANWDSSLTYGQISANAWNAAHADGASLLNTGIDYVSPYARSLVDYTSPYATYFGTVSSFFPAAIRNGDIFTTEGLGYLPEGLAAAGLTVAGGKALSITGQAGLKLLAYAPKVASVVSMAFGGLLNHFGYKAMVDVVSITHKGVSNTIRQVANVVMGELSNTIEQISNVALKKPNPNTTDVEL